MRRFPNILALSLFLCAASANVVLGGIVLEDYRQRTVLGYTTSGLYDPHEPYSIGTDPWIAKLDPLRPTDIVRGGTANFLAVLTAAFPPASGWSFVAAANDLSDGSLKVHSYDVDGTPTRVGIEFPLIGFDVEYVPGVGDPTANVHWIQVVTNNHNVTNNPGHGNPENVVDNPFSPGGRAPYYDDGGAADSRNFLDAPARNDANMTHHWIADLYLVTGPAPTTPGQVTIYNGIRWGWENHPVPEPSTLVLFGLGALGLFGSGWLRRRNGATKPTA
jgi:hypothetical protein